MKLAITAENKITKGIHVMKKIILIVLVSIALSSCATQTFQIKNRAPENPASTDMNFFWLGGIIQSREFNASAICNGEKNVSKIVAKQTAIDGLLSVITAGIFTPRHVYVYC